MQPRTRTHDVDADVDADRRAVADRPRGPRHAGAGDDGPRMPATIPITVAAMTYGRHAADEGWGDLRAAARSREAPGGQQSTWRHTWGRVHDLTLRLGARMRGGVA